jgi:Spy/CpxP family protein refolding chaperone
MKQLTSRIVPVAVALLLCGAAARAQGPLGDGPDGDGPQSEGPQGEGSGPRRPHGPQQAMTRMLGLDEAQQEKLRDILDEERPQREALHEKMSANREALHKLLEGGTADANAVGELVLEGRRLRDEGRALFEAEQKKVRAILNPDQQKKFDAFQERMKERRERGRDGFGPGGFGGPGEPGGFGHPGGPGGNFSKQPRSTQPPPQL